jgi:hypothetical protein
MALKIDENHQVARDLKYMLIQKHKFETNAKKSNFKSLVNSTKFAI